MPSLLDDYLQWTEDYEQVHDGEVGTTNDETLEQAVANRIWSQEFAAREGRAPNEQEWVSHYYRDQLPESRGFERNQAQANSYLDRVFAEYEQQQQGGQNRTTPLEFVDNTVGFVQDARKVGSTLPRPVAPINHFSDALNAVWNVTAPLRRQQGGMPLFATPSEQAGWYGRDPVYPTLDGSEGLSALPESGAMAYQMPFSYEGAEFLQGFGENPEQYTNGIGNPGPDWKLPIGTDINPIAPGEVVFAGWDDTGWGNTIQVRHPDGTTSRYSHLSDIGVEVGDTVAPNQAIAQSGNTGYWWGEGWNGEHLDLSMTNAQGQLVDPLPYIGQPYAWAEPSGNSRIPGIASPPSQSLGTPYDEYIYGASEQYGVDPALIAGLIQQESSFNPQAVSGAGAQGLVQMMPPTWGEWGEGDPFDPQDSINAGTAYLDYLIDYYDGDVSTALLAYHDGMGNVNRGTTTPLGRNTYVPSVLGYAQGYGY
jgi:murein DD-endopeptidase MepM/ murein hydrolase activator NlpD